MSHGLIWLGLIKWDHGMALRQSTVPAKSFVAQMHKIDNT